MNRILTITIFREEDGLSVETIMKTRLHLTRHQIRSARYRNRGICLNGIQVRTNTPVHTGDLLSIVSEEEPVDGKILPTAYPLDILYEDEDLIVINKPGGMVVHPAHGHYSDTLLNYLAAYDREQNTNHLWRCIGRLDKETSGAILFTKNKIAAARLSADHAVSKSYLALISGIPVSEERTITLPIRPVPTELNRMETAPDGLPAVTHYELLCHSEEASLCRLRLETGRTHQIRVHMASQGHPLLGDKIYGKLPAGNMERCALHCEELHFCQPFTDKEITIRAPLPDDFIHCCKAIGLPATPLAILQESDSDDRR